ncbi:MAG: winged helix DNA-binding protein [Sinomonas sp.]|nr:winged helix DNA-binding protein [Sinomonas sp.]
MTSPAAVQGTDPGEALAPSELRYLVLAAQREGNRALMRLLGPLDLTPSQAEILLVLDEFGPLTLRHVGEMIVCEAGSPSRIVDVLAKRRLIRRRTLAADRRSVQLELTEAGAALVPHLKEIENGLDQHAAAVLSPEEQAAVGAALRKFLAGTGSEGVFERRFAGKRHHAQ